MDQETRAANSSSANKVTKWPSDLKVDTLLDDLHAVFQSLEKSSLTAESYDCVREDSTQSKSTSAAVEFRNRGNALFKKKRDNEALLSYTESVAAAVEGSEELALAYANRSAVLFYLCKYEPCVLDINRALNTGKYPEHLKTKLNERKRRCLVSLRMTGKDGGCKVPGGRSDDKDAIDAVDSREDNEEIHNWRENCDLKNPLLRDSSLKITLHYDETSGRHSIVATEDMKPGEIISCGEFFLLELKPELRCTNCAYCLVKCDALISCPSCTRALYCSERCRTRAFTLYHRTECELTSFYRGRKLSPHKAMALRALLTGTEQGSKLEYWMKKFTIQDIFKDQITPDGKRFANAYLSILSPSRQIDDPKCVKTAVRPAVETIVALRRIQFFQKASDIQCGALPACLNDAELFAAALLINHLVLLERQNFGVLQMLQPDKFTQSRETLIGTGICGLHNLINHSCNPNAHIFVQERRQIVFASRPIRKGEQICISYHRLHTFAPGEKRTGTGFVVNQCQSCVIRWPLMMGVTKIKFLSNDVEKASGELLDLVAPIQLEGTEWMEPADMLELLFKLVALFYKYIKAPLSAVVMGQELLRKYMAMIFGDHFCSEFSTQCQGMEYLENQLRVIQNCLLDIGPSDQDRVPEELAVEMLNFRLQSGLML